MPLNWVSLFLQIFLLGLGLISPLVNKSMSSYQLPESPLQLDTRVKSAKYCKGGTLHIQLALVYKNDGDKTIILYKGANDISQVMVSVSLESLATKNYTYDASLMVISNGEPSIKADESLPNKNFIIIPPGASYETTSSTNTVLILKEAQENNQDLTLTPGNHYLQFKVSIWPFPKN